jgi:hypothetical protein
MKPSTTNRPDIFDVSLNLERLSRGPLRDKNLRSSRLEAKEGDLTDPGLDLVERQLLQAEAAAHETR